MSKEKIEAALAHLKQEIQGIRPELELEKDGTIINDELYSTVFVNKDLNNATSTKADTEIQEKSIKAAEQYGDQVLLAIWRIANISAQGYTTAFKKRAQLQALFDSLDKGKGVPKIINETTYKAGLALQKFLAFALTDDFLEQFPEFMSFRDTAKKYLNNMSELLQLRMDIYKLHTPEKIKDIKTIVTAKNRIVTVCNSAKENLNNAQVQINGLIQTSTNNSDEPLTADSTSTVAILETINEKIKPYEKIISDSNLTYETQMSTKVTLPDKITTSLYVNELINPRTKSEQLVQNWENLYNQNQKSYRPTPLDINNEVTKALATVKEGIDNLTQMLEQLKTVRQQLLNRITDAKSLEDYEIRLKTALEETTDEPALPESSNIEEKNINYFSSLIEQYETYQQQITDQTNALIIRKNNLSTVHPIPMPIISSSRAAFEAAQKAAETQLDQKIAAGQKKMTEVELLIHKAKDELKIAREKEAQQSKEGREKFLASIQESIKHMKEEHEPVDKTSQELNKIVEKLNDLINDIDTQLKTNNPDELEKSRALKLSYEQQRKDFAEQIKHLNHKHHETFAATLALKNLSLSSYQLKYKALDIADSHKKLKEDISAITFEKLDAEIASLEELKKLQYEQQMAKIQNGTSGNQIKHMLFLQQTLCESVLANLNKLEPSPDLTAEYGNLIEDIKASESSLVELEATNKILMDIINSKLQTLKNLQHIRTIHQQITTKYPDLLNPLPGQKPTMNRNELIDKMAEDIKTSAAVLHKYSKIIPNAELILLQQKHDQLSLAYETIRLTRIKENADSLISRPARSRNEKTALQYYIRELHRSEGTYLRSIAKGPILNNKLYQSVTLSLEKLKQFTQELNLKSDQDLIENEFEDRYKTLEQTFYDSPNGIFPKYLTERAKKYALSDVFESWVAWGLSCFSYKTRVQERSEFINTELKEALDKYKNEPKFRAENYEILSQLIETGLKNFAPRSKKGDNYQNSLQRKLTSLQEQLDEVNLLNLEQNNKGLSI